MKPDNPVTPTVRSSPPRIGIIANPTVALSDPWMMAAAITDFALILI